MGRGSITLYIMIIAGMGIVLSGWWYRNIWFKVEETIEIYVNVFWICVCLLAALSIYGWRMHELQALSNAFGASHHRLSEYGFFSITAPPCRLYVHQLW